MKSKGLPEVQSGSDLFWLVENVYAAFGLGEWDIPYFDAYGSFHGITTSNVLMQYLHCRRGWLIDKKLCEYYYHPHG